MLRAALLFLADLALAIAVCCVVVALAAEAPAHGCVVIGGAMLAGCW
jgi:hypothetical protein